MGTRVTEPVSLEDGDSSHRARLPGRWGLQSQSLSPWKMGTPVTEPVSHLSGGRGFYKEPGEQTKAAKGGACKVLSVQTSTVHSHKTSDGLVSVTPS